MLRDALENARRLLTNPQLARDFGLYVQSKLRNQGQAVRYLYQGAEITSFSSFSEFHSCAEFVEDGEHSFLTCHPFPEGPILDVGANLGIVSLILAHRYPDRSIHAFEPNPSTVRALKENLEHNAAANIRIQDVAVGGKTGTVQFNAHPQNRGTARRETEDMEHTRNVSCITLDDYVDQEDLHQIALLKVDVEGYEKSVFEGAKRLLGNQRATVVYFEVCPALSQEAGFDPMAPASMLEGWGYDLYRLTPDGSLKHAQPEEIGEVELENWVGLKN
ncbi:FkbM family methyltransferase [Salinibacter ruber]|uniref:FkbM family methyltransferase n=1 Tax=Salinibacter ruber TaxID=146919 RepID=UPI002167D9C9|nr:FkbM family methyltransferase [Salinibacter ruber]MCS3685488.1 FkbM family methyltransferase [Salinibacter ruber]